jgi:hypothetical protein
VVHCNDVELKTVAVTLVVPNKQFKLPTKPVPVLVIVLKHEGFIVRVEEDVITIGASVVGA